MLLLFFFSYAGPLSKEELQAAHEKGFVRPIGSGPLPHVRRWPQELVAWSDGDPRNIARLKSFYITNPGSVEFLYTDAEVGDCLKNNWPEDFQSPIRSLLEEIFTTFRESLKGNKTHKGRTEVSHTEIIKVLEDWLKEHSELGRKYSANHQEFEDTRSAKV